MSGTAWVVIVLLTVWLLVGTSMLILLVQQVATLTALVTRGISSVSSDAEVSPTSRVPNDLSQYLPGTRQMRILVFASDTSNSCHELLEQHGNATNPGNDRLVWVLLGDSWEDQARELPGPFAVTGQRALKLFQWSGLRGVPSAISIRDEIVEEVHPVLSEDLLKNFSLNEGGERSEDLTERPIVSGGHDYAAT